MIRRIQLPMMGLIQIPPNMTEEEEQEWFKQLKAKSDQLVQEHLKRKEIARQTAFEQTTATGSRYWAEWLQIYGRTLHRLSS